MQARVASLEESLAGEQASARDAAAAKASLELSLREQQSALREANSEWELQQHHRIHSFTFLADASSSHHSIKCLARDPCQGYSAARCQWLWFLHVEGI